MFDGVDQKLRHDQPDTYGLAGDCCTGTGLHHHTDGSVGTDHRLCETITKLRQIRTDLDAIAESSSAQLLLHGRHRHDSLVRILSTTNGSRTVSTIASASVRVFLTSIVAIRSVIVETFLEFGILASHLFARPTAVRAGCDRTHACAEARALTPGSPPQARNHTDGSVGTDHRLCETITKLCQIRTDLDAIAESSSAQLLLHGRHRHDSSVRILSTTNGSRTVSTIASTSVRVFLTSIVAIRSVIVETFLANSGFLRANFSRGLLQYARAAIELTRALKRGHLRPDPHHRRESWRTTRSQGHE